MPIALIASVLIFSLSTTAFAVDDVCAGPLQPPTAWRSSLRVRTSWPAAGAGWVKWQSGTDHRWRLAASERQNLLKVYEPYFTGPESALQTLVPGQWVGGEWHFGPTGDLQLIAGDDQGNLLKIDVGSELMVHSVFQGQAVEVSPHFYRDIQGELQIAMGLKGLSRVRIMPAGRQGGSREVYTHGPILGMAHGRSPDGHELVAVLSSDRMEILDLQKFDDAMVESFHVNDGHELNIDWIYDEKRVPHLLMVRRGTDLILNSPVSSRRARVSHGPESNNDFLKLEMRDGSSRVYAAGQLVSVEDEELRSPSVPPLPGRALALFEGPEARVFVVVFAEGHLHVFDVHAVAQGPVSSVHLGDSAPLAVDIKSLSAMRHMIAVQGADTTWILDLSLRPVQAQE